MIPHIAIPSADMDAASKTRLRQSAMNSSLVITGQYMMMSENSLVQRDLLPDDLGLSSWKIGKLESGKYFKWINCQTNNNSVAIYKLLSEIPFVGEIIFEVNGGKVHQMQTDCLFSGLPIWQTLKRAIMSEEAEEVLNRMVGSSENINIGHPMEGWINQPLVIKPFDRLTITILPKENTESGYVLLGGIVTEPHGRVIV